MSEELLHNLIDNRLIRALCIVLVVLLVQLIVRSSVDRIVGRVVRGHRYSSKQEERKRERTLKGVFRTSSAIILWIIGIILVLWSFHINIGALLTGAGIVSVVAGLSAQSVIKDYLAGVFIIMENQYRVDDIVRLATPTATVSGVVEDISIRMTRLRDMDGNLHIVSNGQIGVITNMSYQFANVNIDITVSYATDMNLVEKLINEAGALTAKDERFAEDIIKPVGFLRVEALNESNVTVKALGKVKPGSQWAIGGDFRRHLKDLFTRHHIAVPYASAIVKEVEDGTSGKKK